MFLPGYNGDALDRMTTMNYKDSSLIHFLPVFDLKQLGSFRCGGRQTKSKGHSASALKVGTRTMTVFAQTTRCTALMKRKNTPQPLSKMTLHVLNG